MVARFFRSPRFVFAFAFPLFSAFAFACLPSSLFLLPASASYRPQSVRFVMPFLSFFYVTEFIWLFCLALFPFSSLSRPSPSLPHFCICACLAAIRQKFPVSLVDDFRVFAGWQMVLI